MERASADVERTMEKANAEGKMSVSIPDGHSVNSVGLDPEKMQMIEAQRFVIEQIARIFGLPPVFLQDLTHGTFSNTEMQDGNVAKHAINHLASQWEQELKLKLFGRDEADYSVSIVLDGLLRGDFKTRMDGLARGVQSGQLTPNEARALDNRPPLPGGDVLYVQGAMVPLAETKPGDGSDGQDN
jgi:HK97 family phage portal protein